MTRTFYFGEVSDDHRHIYETVRRANEEAIAKVKPGVPLCELDLTARNLIGGEGFGPNFNHRLGHFIGLGEHEYGDVSSVNTQKAEPGMIFLHRAGNLYTGDTGVRIEDLVLVTEDGCEVLNHYPEGIGDYRLILLIEETEEDRRSGGGTTAFFPLCGETRYSSHIEVYYRAGRL